MKSPLEGLINKEKYFTKKNTFYAISLVVIVVLLIALNIFLAIKLKERDQTIGEEPSSYTKSEDFWQIDAVQPSTNSGFLKITVASITGKIKYFDSVSSYKISPSGKLLALLSQNGVEVHNLDTGNVVKGASTGSKISSDKGETISWAYSNDKFLLNVFIDDNTKNTESIIYKSSGEILSRLKLNLVVEKKDADQKIYGAVFSPYSDLILTREFDPDDQDVTKEDGTAYKITELPIYLRIYDISGDLVQSSEINDFANTPMDVAYNWDEVEDFISYLVYDAGKELNTFPETLYTKMRVKANEPN